MTRYADRYHELNQFFGAYFHQDWSYEQRLAGGSFEDVVRYLQAMNPVDVVRQAT
jgi:hypothetical protein